MSRTLLAALPPHTLTAFLAIPFALSPLLALPGDSPDNAEAPALADQRRQQIEQEAEQIVLHRSEAAAWVDQFNRWYPKFLKSLHATGDVLITATHTVLIAFGVRIVLLVFLQNVV